MSTANGFAVKTHFEGKEVFVRQIYDALLKHLLKFGPAIEDPKKTSIHLMNKTASPEWPPARAL